MKELEEFVDKARKTFDDLPFISDYLNKNLKHKELVGTYLYNQTLIIQKLEVKENQLKVLVEYQVVQNH